MRSAVAVAAVSLFLPAVASASTAKVVEYHGRADGAGVVYTAAAGEANDLSLQSGGDGHSIVLVDPGADITPGDGCTPTDSHTVTCTSQYELDSVSATLGDEKDHFTSEGPYFYVDGGPGDDVLHGGEAGGDFVGGAGDDVMDAGKLSASFYGGPGDDQMTGGPDRDFFRGGPGDDTIDGGGDPQTSTLGDTVDYRDHAGPVKVDLSAPGSASGGPGENDQITNVENVDGTRRGDTITAPQTVPNPDTGSRIRGFGGADVIVGSPGPDDLDGGLGDDSIAGGDGGDSIFGGAGRDRLRGGSGDDFIYSGEGFTAQRDSVDCGDTGTAGPGFGTEPERDVIDQSCDRIRLSSFPVTTLRYAYSGSPTRTVATTMTCLRRCRVEIGFRVHGTAIGTARRALRRGESTTLTIPLTDRARRELANKGRLDLGFWMSTSWGQRLRNETATSWHLLLHDSAPSR